MVFMFQEEGEEHEYQEVTVSTQEQSKIFSQDSQASSAGKPNLLADLGHGNVGDK